MLTFAISYVIRGLATMVPGMGTQTHSLEAPYKGALLEVGGLVIAAEQVVVVAGTFVLCALLYVLFRFTRLGIAMQASSENRLAAYFMGIHVDRLNGIVWGLAAMLAGISGILLAPMTFVHADMGHIALKAFTAAIVGGFSSLPGAIVGGLVIGLSESLSGLLLPEGVKDVAPYIVVLIMLMVKPSGLFGSSVRKRV